MLDKILFLVKTYYLQFIKYFFVGFICALINWSVFYIFNYRLHLYYPIAALIAFIVSTTVNFFLSKLIFISKGRRKTTEYLLIVLISSAALAIDLGVMYLLIEFVSMPRLLAKISGTGTAFMVNYLGRQFFIFSSEK